MIQMSDSCLIRYNILVVEMVESTESATYVDLVGLDGSELLLYSCSQNSQPFAPVRQSDIPSLRPPRGAHPACCVQSLRSASQLSTVEPKGYCTDEE